MKPKLLLGLALVLGGGLFQSALGYEAAPYPITHANLKTDYPFLLINAVHSNKTNDDEMVSFKVTVLPKNGHKPDNFRGYLDIKDGEKYIVTTRVAHSEFPKGAGADFMEFTFLVSTRYLSDSEFRLTEAADFSSGMSYSFKLKEFADEK